MPDHPLPEAIPIAAPAPESAGFLAADKPDWAAIRFEVGCPQCHYNLRTLTEPCCPECGRRFEWKPVVDEAARRAGAAAYLDADVPMWGAIDFDVSCSRCAYNLRTLSRPRCPECGLDFRWEDMLDRSAWRSDFLFEHHCMTRPVRSWLKTVWRSFRPRRFWRQVSIHDRIRAGPLWGMLGLSLVAFYVTLHAGAWFWSQGLLSIDHFLYPSAQPAPGAWTPGAFGGGTRWWGQQSPLQPSARRLSRLASTPIEAFGDWFMQTLAAGSILLALLVMLCSLRQSLGRRRVRTVQMLRVVAYAITPGLLWLALAIHLAIVSRDLLSYYFLTPDPVGLLPIFLGIILIVIYLGTGLKRYLGLPGPWRVAAVSLFVAILFTMTMFVFGSLTLQGGWR